MAREMPGGRRRYAPADRTPGSRAGAPSPQAGEESEEGPKLPLHRWVVAPSLPEDVEPSSVSRVLRQVLWNRDLREPSEIAAFLHGEVTHSTDPFRMRDMDRAVERVAEARSRGELVAVYGDYDVDGITALVLLDEALREIGLQTTHHIPNRLDEGYGLNCDAISTLHLQGVKLLISVDCGISSAREIEYAASLGMDVIVTDHHATPAQLPPAVAVLNPHRGDCGYPFKDLAGVGVAYKLAQGLLHRLAPRGEGSPSEVEHSLLDLVALGTVADVVPLRGENRSLVMRGLSTLNATARPGLQELAKVAGLRLGEITSDSIGYGLGPRLNAAGRLYDASTSLELLLTRDAHRARKLAQELEQANQKRQQMTEEALRSAREQVQARQPTPSVLLVRSPDYSVGIVGLVASKLTEEYYRPALVVCLNDQKCRGSARSIEELDIMHAFQQCQDLLDRFGGHSRAAGFTVLNPNLDELQRRLEAVAAEAYGGREPEARLVADCQLPASELSLELYNQLARLAPFGYGNLEPLLWVKSLRLLEARPVGKGQVTHLKMRLHDGRRPWNAIWFGMGSLADDLKRAVHVEIAANLRLNQWSGSSSLELQVRDLWPK